MKDKKATQIGLTPKVLKTVSAELEKLLATTYDLYYQTQACHWNVVSPQFAMYHQLFEDQYNTLTEAVDEVAERMRMLGHFTPMNLKKLLPKSLLQPLPFSATTDKMVEALLNGHEKIAKELRKMADVADEVDDEGTMDFFIERLRAHEKMAWMLRSSL